MEEAKNNNLKQRIISAAILFPAVLLFIVAGGWLFNALMVLAAILMAYEWYSMMNSSDDVMDTDRLFALWLAGGAAYVVIPVTSLISLRADPEGLRLVLWMFCVVWATDVCAFFAGRKIGGPKLAPKISPKKTWSGLIGGMAGAMLVGVVTAFISPGFSVRIIIFSGMLAIVSQAGDLLESWVKRYFDVKDSGALIPGHGGLLDRIDGVVTVVPVVLLANHISELF